VSDAKFRKVIFVFGLLILCMPLGCLCYRRSQASSREATGLSKLEEWRRIESRCITKLMVGVSDDGGYSFKKLLTIEEREFVQAIFGVLASQKPVAARRHLFIGPKLLVFLDDHDNALCSFLYWPAGKPNNIFRPCQLGETNGVYHVEWPGPPASCVVLPGFDERVRRYLDVWK
jgi:hypothetical protein